MAQEAEADAIAALAARTYVTDESAWDEAEGQEFGGKSDVINILVGEIAGPFVYAGHQSMVTDLGEATVHIANTSDGESVRLPISATFVRAVDAAGLAFGDTFLVRRSDDVKKKKGKGAGNMIPVYAIKVTSRVARPAVTA